MTRQKMAMVALLAFLLLPGVSYALTADQKVLVGLKGMAVTVDQIQPEAENLGLTQAQIQVDVELRLRKAGIRVLTRDERLNTPGWPYLFVNVNTSMGRKFALCAYAVTVGLRESVLLERGVDADATIWERTTVGAIEKSKIRGIREYVGDGIDIFINDYLVANPKK